MALDTTARSPVFDALLSVNPWAREPWSDRLELIAAGVWNINAVNQAGNDRTRSWLKAFSDLRVAETATRLFGPRAHDDTWTSVVSEVASQIFRDPRIVASRPGTPGIYSGDGSSVLNDSDCVSGYAPGQFLADFLLLAQPSLVHAKFDTAIDLSGRVFPIGPDLSGANFAKGLTANQTKFGPYSDMSSAVFGDASFRNSEFYGHVSWALSRFATVNFTGAHFRRSAEFHATFFSGNADFSMARFDNDASFAGSVFRAGSRFDDARMTGRVTFEHSQFAEMPSLEGTVVERPIVIVGVSKATRKLLAGINPTRRSHLSE